MCFDATVIFVFVHCQSVCAFLLASDFQFSVTVSSSSLPVSAFCLWCFYSWVDVVPYLLHVSMIRVPFKKKKIGGTFSHCSVTCRLKNVLATTGQHFVLIFFSPEDLGDFFFGGGGGVPPPNFRFQVFSKTWFWGPSQNSGGGKRVNRNAPHPAPEERWTCWRVPPHSLPHSRSAPCRAGWRWWWSVSQREQSAGSDSVPPGRPASTHTVVPAGQWRRSAVWCQFPRWLTLCRCAGRRWVRL